jgi:hypothetical protein
MVRRPHRDRRQAAAAGSLARRQEAPSAGGRDEGPMVHRRGSDGRAKPGPAERMKCATPRLTRTRMGITFRYRYALMQVRFDTGTLRRKRIRQRARAGYAFIQKRSYRSVHTGKKAPSRLSVRRPPPVATPAPPRRVPGRCRPADAGCAGQQPATGAPASTGTCVPGPLPVRPASGPADRSLLAFARSRPNPDRVSAQPLLPEWLRDLTGRSPSYVGATTRLRRTRAVCLPLPF